MIKDTDLMYRIHLDKIRRWLKKLESFYIRQDDLDFDELLDCYEIYCIFCYHLSDYLIQSCLFDSKKVYDYIDSHLELKVCKDICNKTKHLILERPKVDSNVRITKLFVSSNVISKRPHLYFDWEVEVLDGKINPLELAKKCLSLWESFIISCGQNALPVA